MLPHLHAMFKAGELAPFHAVSGPTRSRSHFEAQDRLEMGGENRLSSGWLNRLAGLLEARGCDIACGLFHEPHAGRPSLACDLAEEFRAALVDRLVLRGCNTRVFQLRHFGPAPGGAGVRMSDEGLKLFFREWHKALASPLHEADGTIVSGDDALRRQVERFAAALKTGTPYAALRLAGIPPSADDENENEEDAACPNPPVPI